MKEMDNGANDYDKDDEKEKNEVRMKSRGQGFQQLDQTSKESINPEAKLRAFLESLWQGRNSR